MYPGNWTVPPPDSSAALVRAHADFWALPRASPIVRSWLFPGGDSAVEPSLNFRAGEPVSRGEQTTAATSGNLEDGQVAARVSVGTGCATGPSTRDTGRLFHAFPESTGLALLHVCSAPSCAAGPDTRTTVLKRTGGVPVAVSSHPGGLTLGYIISEVWTSPQIPNVECVARFAHNHATKEVLKVTIVRNGREIYVDRFVGLVPGCFLHDHIVARPSAESPPGHSSLGPGVLPEPLHIDSRTTALLRRRETAAPAGAVSVPATDRNFGQDALGFYDFKLVTPSGGYLNGVPQPAPPMSSDVRAPPEHLAHCRMPSVAITELASHEKDSLRERLVTILTRETEPITALGAAPLTRNVGGPRLNIIEPTNDCQLLLDPSPSLTSSSPVTWISASSTPGALHAGRPPSLMSTPGSAMKSISPIGQSPIRDTPATRQTLSHVVAPRAASVVGPESSGLVSTLGDAPLIANEPEQSLEFRQNPDFLLPSTEYVDPVMSRIVQTAIQSHANLATQNLNQQLDELNLPQSQQASHVIGSQAQLQLNQFRQTLAGTTLQSVQQGPPPVLQDDPARPADFAQGQLAHMRLSRTRQPPLYAYSQAPLENELQLPLHGELRSHRKKPAPVRKSSVSRKAARQAEPGSFLVEQDILPQEPPTERRGGDVIFPDLSGSGASSGHGTSGIYEILVTSSGTGNGDGNRPALGDIDPRLESVAVPHVLENPTAVLASPPAMTWLAVGQGAPEPLRASVPQIQPSLGGPNASDVFGSLPLPTQSVPLIDGPTSCPPHQVIAGASGEAAGSVVASEAVSDILNSGAGGSEGQTASSSGALAVLSSDRKPDIAPGRQSRTGRIASRDEGLAAAGSNATSTGRTRGRGGRGCLAATPSDIVMRNRISAQKSNEKRRRRILASKNELALLKSVTLPRLQVAQLVLRAENERVRQALANKYGRLWVKVESFF